MEYTAPNEGSETAFKYSLQYNVSLNSRNLTPLTEIVADCNKNGPVLVRVYMQVLVLALALPANTVLLWLMVKKRKTLSPSEVLGLNFAVLGVLFCLSLPLDIYITITKDRVGLLQSISNAFAILSYFGCPLLLTSLCLERYVAVAHPVLFMKLGKWEYRAACSAIIWFLTCVVAAAAFFYTVSRMAVVLSLIINVLFLAMLACLLGIIWVLCKKGPGEGDQNNSVVKRHALKNVLTVLLPSAITYFPLLGLAPFLLIIPRLVQKSTNTLICIFLMMAAVVPNFGVCIGSIFYMARLKQMFCHRKNKSGDTAQTTTVQRT
ncbi:P2Y purinoceptor 1-like [Neoarius graeffei]|uniref:P2Y purinoceptor 1-like n=1 Tax=Neoarius graeffei TaxID=443677 RepID=UPI00298CA08F|nr:P2Y purinoceptor 1-like [Neoarius graeffei]